MSAGLEGALIGGRYRVLRFLGKGGMARVYLAVAEGVAGFEKLVALKVTHAAGKDDDRTVMEMFLEEARPSAQLSHANVAQIYDLGQSDDFFYIAM